MSASITLLSLLFFVFHNAFTLHSLPLRVPSHDPIIVYASRISGIRAVSQVRPNLARFCFRFSSFCLLAVADAPQRQLNTGAMLNIEDISLYEVETDEME
ncbi:hypothetical protein EJ06DRAFT_329225 [Trichodelitschia bisporula]|uniref:Uncharacterized protein n=1 Tax=Trichodelitschia bisporula TaxID=703511 RepID=A0A6G1I1L5_9PEZI|nr:hypothetical protein EJ06DRAFT_329225 [Trichodelitschia bisporula]